MDSTTMHIYHQYRLRHINDERNKQRSYKFADGTLQDYLLSCWEIEGDHVKVIVITEANTLP